MVFYEKQPTYNPQGLKIYNKINRRGGSGKNWSDLKKNSYVQKYTNYPTQTLNFKHDKIKYHPTQKPVALFEYLIKTYTNENEIVLDNCIGSGTTAIACMNTNRNYIGFELDKNYFELANKRIVKHNKQISMFDF